MPAPGASVARLALTHEVNANLLRKWIKAHEASATARAPSKSDEPLPVNAIEAPEAMMPSVPPESLIQIVVGKDIRGKPPDDRQAQRQARAGPLLADLEQWLVEVTATLSAKSDLALAIRYATSRWPALRYRDDGNREIDNSSAERSLRVVAITRRNLFILRLGYGRTSRCGDLQLDRHRQAQQRQSRMSSAGGALVPVSVPEQRFPYGYEGKAFIEIKRASN